MSEAFRGAPSSTSGAAVPSTKPTAPPALRLRRPSWRDRRLLIGLLLVLGSTVLGARLVGGDEHLTEVWVSRLDLASGTTLQTDDLELRGLPLAGLGSGYLSGTDESPVGRLLVRDVVAGELLPAASVAPPGSDADHDGSAGATRVVSVPVDPWHMPADLSRGERVDVYVSAARGAVASVEPRVVAAGAVVVRVETAGGRFGAGGGSEAVLLAVPGSDVARLVGGVADGTVDVVRVPGIGR